jgi:ABC-type glycerol-3-phosphate transport system substrate-binding protein
MPGQKRSKLLRLPALLFLAILIASCTTQTQDAPVASEPSVNVTPTTSAVETSEPSDPVSTLTIWIPKFLSPFEDTPEGTLLSERFSAFEEINPDLELRIRVKDEEGTAGLLETLNAASIAAPSALPDIVALDPVSLDTAVLKGLVIPLDEVYESPSVPAWYQHAIDAVYFGDSYFGIPFVSDTDVFVYRQEAFENPPLGWADLLSGTETFLFPGGDKEASFTLAQYLSLDGIVEDEEGQPSMKTNILRDVLEFYSASEKNGLLPLSSLQYITSDQTSAVLQQIGVSSAVVPLRTFLHSTPSLIFNAQPFPTSDGDGIVLTKTHSWSIVATKGDRQAHAAELIDWLMAPDFLGPWANSLGMLPATSAAISHWPSDETTATVNQLVRVAVPFPHAETVALLGPALQNSIEEVLFNRSTPNAAALMAVEEIRNP